MKVLVIGGTRYFGKRLVNKLISAGHDVDVMSRGQTPPHFDGPFRHLSCDRRNREALLNITKDQYWDIVFDQVCMNAGDARLALEAFSEKVGHYVMTSTQSVYGEGAGLCESAFSPESYDFQEIADETKDYQAAKRQAESIFAKAKNLKSTLVRFPLVVGEDDYTGRLKWHLEKVKRGDPIYLPNLDARITMITSEDAAEGLSQIPLKSITGPLNLASATPVRLKDLMEQIEKLLSIQAIYSSTPSEENWSPVGILNDWFMDSSRAREGGITIRDTEEWLPSLLKHFKEEL
jgi:nucleoside-diphosphate-sugar epimerase